MRVPAFLVRRFYVAGSLRNTPNGFQLQAHNEMGDGTLVGVARITVDGVAMDPAGITAQRDGSDELVRATDITRTAPVRVERGQSVTFRVTAEPLPPGRHELQVELLELNLGALHLSITESVAADGSVAAEGSVAADGSEGKAAG